MEKYIERFAELFQSFEKISLEKGAVLVYSDNADRDSFLGLEETLCENGCEKYAENAEGDNLFATLFDGECVLNISFTPFEGRVRMVAENTTALPPKNLAYDVVAPTLVVQVRPPYFVNDCGMTYVIRLCDGRFAIIDGGAGEYDETVHTMDILRELNARDGVPTVAVWFITHPHGDHFGGFAKMVEDYALSGELVIERLVYNWSVPERTVASSPLEDFDKAVSALKSTEIITARSGQKFVFADTEFDILYTCEDLYPEFIKTLNDTSVVFRMTVGNRRIMWLADIMWQGSEYITKKYPESSLACEFLQVGHHGYWGGSQRLHEMADPETLLWPCPDFWYCEIKDWDCNKFFFNSDKIKHIFVAGEEETVIDMTKPVGDSNPYKKDGKTLASVDFSHGVYNMRVSCITGGSTGYRPLIAENRDGKTVFRAEKAYSLAELAQPGSVKNVERAELCLGGEVYGECTEFSLVFSNPHPTVWNGIYALKLSPSGRFDYRLCIDYKRGEATLYADGAVEKRIIFVPQDRECGIYLAVRDVEFSLEKAELCEV